MRQNASKFIVTNRKMFPEDVTGTSSIVYACKEQSNTLAIRANYIGIIVSSYNSILPLPLFVFMLDAY